MTSYFQNCTYDAEPTDLLLNRYNEPISSTTLARLVPTTEPSVYIEDPRDLYTFIRFIGKGSYATVYHAKHKITGQDVAIKVLTFQKDPPSDSELKALDKELDILQAIGCTYIDYTNPANHLIQPRLSENDDKVERSEKMHELALKYGYAVENTDDSDDRSMNMGNGEKAKNLTQEQSRAQISSLASSSQLNLPESHSGMLVNHQINGCPYIVKFLECYRFTKQIWIVMEYCEYGNMEYFLQNVHPQGALCEFTTGAVAKQLLFALIHLHSLNVIHRDFKVANILISANGQLKVSDFGLSEIGKQYTSGLCGTPYYLANEVCAGEVYNNQVDVWSLGQILYFCLTGAVGSFLTGYNPQQLIRFLATPDSYTAFSLPGKPSSTYIWTKSSERELAQQNLPRNYNWCPNTVDFLRCCFAPHAKRWTPAELLLHPFIYKIPRSFSNAISETLLEYETVFQQIVSDRDFEQWTRTTARNNEIQQIAANALDQAVSLRATYLRYTAFKQNELQLKRIQDDHSEGLGLNVQDLTDKMGSNIGQKTHVAHLVKTLHNAVHNGGNADHDFEDITQNAHQVGFGSVAQTAQSDQNAGFLTYSPGFDVEKIETAIATGREREMMMNNRQNGVQPSSNPINSNPNNVKFGHYLQPPSTLLTAQQELAKQQQKQQQLQLSSQIAISSNPFDPQYHSLLSDYLNTHVEKLAEKKQQLADKKKLLWDKKLNCDGLFGSIGIGSGTSAGLPSGKGKNGLWSHVPQFNTELSLVHSVPSIELLRLINEIDALRAQSLGQSLNPHHSNGVSQPGYVNGVNQADLEKKIKIVQMEQTKLINNYTTPFPYLAQVTLPQPVSCAGGGTNLTISSDFGFGLDSHTQGCKLSDFAYSHPNNGYALGNNGDYDTNLNPLLLSNLTTLPTHLQLNQINQLHNFIAAYNNLSTHTLPHNLNEFNTAYTQSNLLLPPTSLSTSSQSQQLGLSTGQVGTDTRPIHPNQQNDRNGRQIDQNHQTASTMQSLNEGQTTRQNSLDQAIASTEGHPNGQLYGQNAQHPSVPSFSDSQPHSTSLNLINSPFSPQFLQNIIQVTQFGPILTDISPYLNYTPSLPPSALSSASSLSADSSHANSPLSPPLFPEYSSFDPQPIFPYDPTSGFAIGRDYAGFGYELGEFGEKTAFFYNRVTKYLHNGAKADNLSISTDKMTISSGNCSQSTIIIHDPLSMHSLNNLHQFNSTNNPNHHIIATGNTNGNGEELTQFDAALQQKQMHLTPSGQFDPQSLPPSESTGKSGQDDSPSRIWAKKLREVGENGTFYKKTDNNSLNTMSVGDFNENVANNVNQVNLNQNGANGLTVQNPSTPLALTSHQVTSPTFLNSLQHSQLAAQQQNSQKQQVHQHKQQSAFSTPFTSPNQQQSNIVQHQQQYHNPSALNLHLHHHHHANGGVNANQNNVGTFAGFNNTMNPNDGNFNATFINVNALANAYNTHLQPHHTVTTTSIPTTPSMLPQSSLSPTFSGFALSQCPTPHPNNLPLGVLSPTLHLSPSILSPLSLRPSSTPFGFTTPISRPFTPTLGQVPQAHFNLFKSTTPNNNQNGTYSATFPTSFTPSPYNVTQNTTNLANPLQNSLSSPTSATFSPIPLHGRIATNPRGTPHQTPNQTPGTLNHALDGRDVILSPSFSATSSSSAAALSPSTTGALSGHNDQQFYLHQTQPQITINPNLSLQPSSHTPHGLLPSQSPQSTPFFKFNRVQTPNNTTLLPGPTSPISLFNSPIGGSSHLQHSMLYQFQYQNGQIAQNGQNAQNSDILQNYMNNGQPSPFSLQDVERDLSHQQLTSLQWAKFNSMNGRENSAHSTHNVVFAQSGQKSTDLVNNNVKKQEPPSLQALQSLKSLQHALVPTSGLAINGAGSAPGAGSELSQLIYPIAQHNSFTLLHAPSLEGTFTALQPSSTTTSTALTDAEFYHHQHQQLLFQQSHHIYHPFQSDLNQQTPSPFSSFPQLNPLTQHLLTHFSTQFDKINHNQAQLQQYADLLHFSTLFNPLPLPLSLASSNVSSQRQQQQQQQPLNQLQVVNSNSNGSISSTTVGSSTLAPKAAQTGSSVMQTAENTTIVNTPSIQTENATTTTPPSFQLQSTHTVDELDGKERCGSTTIGNSTHNCTTPPLHTLNTSILHSLQSQLLDKYSTINHNLHYFSKLNKEVNSRLSALKTHTFLQNDTFSSPIYAFPHLSAHNSIISAFSQKAQKTYSSTNKWKYHYALRALDRNDATTLHDLVTIPDLKTHIANSPTSSSSSSSSASPQTTSTSTNPQSAQISQFLTTFDRNFVTNSTPQFFHAPPTPIPSSALLSGTPQQYKHYYTTNTSLFINIRQSVLPQSTPLNSVLKTPYDHYMELCQFIDDQRATSAATTTAGVANVNGKANINATTPSTSSSHLDKTHSLKPTPQQQNTTSAPNTTNSSSILLTPEKVTQLHKKSHQFASKHLYFPRSTHETLKFTPVDYIGPSLQEMVTNAENVQNNGQNGEMYENGDFQHDLGEFSPQNGVRRNGKDNNHKGNSMHSHSQSTRPTPTYDSPPRTNWVEDFIITLRYLHHIFHSSQYHLDCSQSILRNLQNSLTTRNNLIKNLSLQHEARAHRIIPKSTHTPSVSSFGTHSAHLNPSPFPQLIPMPVPTHHDLFPISSSTYPHNITPHPFISNGQNNFSSTTHNQYSTCPSCLSTTCPFVLNTRRICPQLVDLYIALAEDNATGSAQILYISMIPDKPMQWSSRQRVNHQEICNSLIIDSVTRYLRGYNDLAEEFFHQEKLQTRLLQRKQATQASLNALVMRNMIGGFGKGASYQNAGFLVKSPQNHMNNTKNYLPTQNYNQNAGLLGNLSQNDNFSQNFGTFHHFPHTRPQPRHLSLSGTMLYGANNRDAYMLKYVPQNTQLAWLKTVLIDIERSYLLDSMARACPNVFDLDTQQYEWKRDLVQSRMNATAQNHSHAHPHNQSALSPQQVAHMHNNNLNTMGMGATGRQLGGQPGAPSVSGTYPLLTLTSTPSDEITENDLRYGYYGPYFNQKDPEMTHVDNNSPLIPYLPRLAAIFRQVPHFQHTIQGNGNVSTKVELGSDRYTGWKNYHHVQKHVQSQLRQDYFHQQQQYQQQEHQQQQQQVHYMQMQQQSQNQNQQQKMLLNGQLGQFGQFLSHNNNITNAMGNMNTGMPPTDVHSFHHPNMMNSQQFSQLSSAMTHFNNPGDVSNNIFAKGSGFDQPIGQSVPISSQTQQSPHGHRQHSLLGMNDDSSSHSIPQSITPRTNMKSPQHYQQLAELHHLSLKSSQSPTHAEAHLQPQLFNQPNHQQTHHHAQFAGYSGPQSHVHLQHQHEQQPYPLQHSHQQLQRQSDFGIVNPLSDSPYGYGSQNHPFAHLDSMSSGILTPHSTTQPCMVLQRDSITPYVSQIGFTYIHAHLIKVLKDFELKEHELMIEQMEQIQKHKNVLHTAQHELQGQFHDLVASVEYYGSYYHNAAQFVQQNNSKVLYERAIQQQQQLHLSNPTYFTVTSQLELAQQYQQQQQQQQQHLAQLAQMEQFGTLQSQQQSQHQQQQHNRTSVFTFNTNTGVDTKLEAPDTNSNGMDDHDKL